MLLGSNPLFYLLRLIDILKRGNRRNRKIDSIDLDRQIDRYKSIISAGVIVRPGSLQEIAPQNLTIDTNLNMDPRNIQFELANMSSKSPLWLLHTRDSNMVRHADR